MACDCLTPNPYQLTSSDKGQIDLPITPHILTLRTHHIRTKLPYTGRTISDNTLASQMTSDEIPTLLRPKLIEECNISVICEIRGKL